MLFKIEITDEQTIVDTDGDKNEIIFHLASLFMNNKMAKAIMKVAIAESELLEAEAEVEAELARNDFNNAQQWAIRAEA